MMVQMLGCLGLKGQCRWIQLLELMMMMLLLLLLFSLMTCLSKNIRQLDELFSLLLQITTIPQVTTIPTTTTATTTSTLQFNYSSNYQDPNQSKHQCSQLLHNQPPPPLGSHHHQQLQFQLQQLQQLQRTGNGGLVRTMTVCSMESFCFLSRQSNQTSLQ